jgi:putative tricarboxylic transport membrane protein
MGTFSVHGSIIEVWLMFAAGIVGFFMKLYGFSPAATVLALVLGPMGEETLRQTLIISRGSPMIFIERGMSLAILLATIAVVVLGLMMNRARTAAPKRSAS